jgi:hypothetical protein
MASQLMVPRSDPRAAVQAPHTHRAGIMVGAAMFLVMALGTFGFGWAAILSALVPVMVGAGAAGTVESSRRAANQLGSPLPLVAGGAWLGAQLGALLAPFWALAAGVLELAGAIPPQALPWGHLLLAGIALGAMAGAATGLAVGTRRGPDPLARGVVAGATAMVLTAGGLYTGAFAALASFVGSWLGVDPATLGAMLVYAPGLLGSLGMAAVSGTAAFAGALALDGAEARGKRLALGD